LPACAIGAPHRRDRLWIVANARSFEHKSHSASNERTGTERLPETSPNISNAVCDKLREQSRRSGRENGQSSALVREHGAPQLVAYGYGSGQPVFQRQRSAAESHGRFIFDANDWWGVEPGMGRVADGIPDRVGKLRGFGNAIVPQVAAEFVAAALEVAP
jgi:DNA (cytosine-5)-methyltransferase 1